MTGYSAVGLSQANCSPSLTRGPTENRVLSALSGSSPFHARSIESATYLTESRIWRCTAFIFLRVFKTISPPPKFTRRSLESDTMRSSRSMSSSVYIRVLLSVGDGCRRLAHSYRPKVFGWVPQLSVTAEIV